MCKPKKTNNYQYYTVFYKQCMLIFGECEMQGRPVVAPASCDFIKKCVHHIVGANRVRDKSGNYAIGYLFLV
jgi:hypothetical protein